MVYFMFKLFFLFYINIKLDMFIIEKLEMYIFLNTLEI